MVLGKIPSIWLRRCTSNSALAIRAFVFLLGFGDSLGAFDLGIGNHPGIVCLRPTDLIGNQQTDGGNHNESQYNSKNFNQLIFFG